MTKYFLFFCFLSVNCFAQTKNSLAIELDSFIKKEVKQVNNSKIIAIKKAVNNIQLFKEKKLTTNNADSLYNSTTELIKKENIQGLLAWAYAEH